MPKVWIDSDELCPFYFLTDNGYWGVEVDLTDSELDWVNKVGKQFAEMQDFLKRKYVEDQND